MTGFKYLAKNLYAGIRVQIDNEFCLITSVKVDKENWQETMIVVEYQFAGSERETIMFCEWEVVTVKPGFRGVNIISVIE